MERASLPVRQLGDPRVIRAVLDGLCTRLDGSPAAANTITRKRAVFHGTLGYAVELGLLPANPIGLVRWRAPRAAAAVSPATVASPAQVRAILAQVARIKPELAAFFGCLYYAASRPEEAVTLRRANLTLPARGRGKVILTAACPRTGSALTNTGRSMARQVSSTARRRHPRRPHPARPGQHALPSPRRPWHHAGRETVPRRLRRHAQRVGLRPRLARRPPGRARPAPSRHRARPPPV